MKLFREKKNGETYVDLRTSGHWKYTIGDTNPDINAWEDVTSIPNWMYWCSRNTKDFWWCQDRIDDVRTDQTWAALSTADKYTVIDHGAYKSGDADKVAFLMGEGLTLQEAQGYLLSAWKTNMPKAISSARARTESEKFFEVIGTYLPKANAEDLLETVADLLSRFKNAAHVGTIVPGSTPGIWDYMHNTVGTDYETAGIDAKETVYTLNTGTWTEFKDALNDVVFNGNY
jgi:hypothetical protein